MQIMGILESKPASPQNNPVSTEAVSVDGREERFKEEVRKSAENFKNLVMRNKVMIFSATYCSYCTVAKVSPIRPAEVFYKSSPLSRTPWTTSGLSSRATR